MTSVPTIDSAETSGDIQLLFDEKQQGLVDDRGDDAGHIDTTRPRWLQLLLRWRWLLPVLPWLWFPLRSIHPWLEIVAILMPVVLPVTVFLSLLLAAFKRSWLSLAFAASLAVFLVATIMIPRSPIASVEPTSPTRFASINVARRWFSFNDVGWFVAQEEPEVFLGLELSTPHNDDLQERFEYSITDLFGDPPDPLPVGGLPNLDDTYRNNDGPSIGLYSNYELELLEDPIASEISGGLPGIRALVDLPEGQIVLYGLHIPRPGTGSGVYEVRPNSQRDLVNAIVNAIEAEDLPVVVMGDLNLVDRGHSYQQFADDLLDVMRVDGWADPTRQGDLWHTLLQLRVDYLLISPELCAMDAQASAVFYTDHRPIQADIGPCPSS